MSGGLTDPPKAPVTNRLTVVQGANAGELLDALVVLPPDAKVVWVDSYKPEEGVTVAGIGFASPTPG